MWPFILVGCGLLFLIGIVAVAYTTYSGLQKAKAGLAEAQQDFETAQKTQTTTPIGGAPDWKTGTTKGDGKAGTDDEKEPVIEVGDGDADPEHPATAYRVEDVPALAEGQETGPVTSGDQAAGLVLAEPETQEWVQAIEQARAEGKKRTAMVTVDLDPSSDHYMVHLFESVEDDDPGHTATFGWFGVSKEDGTVSQDTVDSD